MLLARMADKLPILCNYGTLTAQTLFSCNLRHYKNMSLSPYFKAEVNLLCRLHKVSWRLLSEIEDENHPFRSDHSLSRVWHFVTPWISARQASLSITNSRSSLRLMSIESAMPSSHLILCRPLLLLLPIPPSIRVFSSESTLHMRWPKYWSFSFSIIPSKEIPRLISFRIGVLIF